MKIWIPKYGFHNYRKNELFLAPKIWISHPSTVILFLLVDGCRKNKIRTKIRAVSLSQNYLVLTKKQKSKAFLKNKKTSGTRLPAFFEGK